LRWFAVYQSGKWYAGTGDSRKGTQISLHRFILQPPQNIEVDHIDGDGLNNRRSNLRLATDQQQSMNRRRINKSKSSKFKGVLWAVDARYRKGGRWLVHIRADGKTICRSARTEEDAARLYNRLAIQYFGEFAKVNEDV
jgi:hypothetical protein